VEEKPEAIEISPGDGSPWVGGTPSSSSKTLLSGDVASFGGEGENSPYWTNPSMERKGLSNGAWFVIGLIPTPIAMWITSFVLVIMAEGIGSGIAWDFLFTLSWLVWPIGLIGGIVWSFTRGNKYFAFGLLTTLIGLPAVLFLALIVFLISLGAF
jgi:hypothetical protein|tara:strand:+ start:70 stop:534 length:465 start_codon:yes stop_codon:yes gene_type:complete